MRVRALLLLLLLPACVAPARSATDYENKAVDTANAVLSSVQTGSLVVDLVPEQVLPPFVSVTLSDAERAATSARATFLSIRPPDPGSDVLREELSALLDRSEDALSAARIAARRQDVDALHRSADDLSSAADSLERFVARHG